MAVGDTRLVDSMEGVPREVVVLGLLSEDGFTPLARIDGDGEIALSVFTNEKKLAKAIATFNREESGPLPVSRHLCSGGMSFSFEEAARMAYGAGCDYMGLDMGQGVEYRTFYIHSPLPEENQGKGSKL